MPFGYTKNDKLLPVEHPTVSGKYHVDWGKSNGVIGICISVDEVNKTVILRSPKTKKVWANPVKWSALRHTRKAQFKIEKQLTGEELNTDKLLNQ